MLEVTQEQMEKMFNEHFGGKDPIHELTTRLQTMSHTDLMKLVMVGCNKLGTAIKGGDYESVYDSVLHVNKGADQLLQSYDDAVLMNSEAGTA